MGTAIEVASGKLFDFSKPTVGAIKLEDIAQALGNTCRFNGHTKRFYSVAEHSVFVKELVKAHGGTVEQQLAALFHDAHEAYVGDMPTPLKEFVRACGDNYDRMVEQVDVAIGRKFKFDPATMHDDIIRNADLAALWHEAKVLLKSGGEHLGFAPVPEWQDLRGVDAPSLHWPLGPNVGTSIWLAEAKLLLKEYKALVAA